MADFSKAHAITMGHEGGYANNPKDKGGETYKGISRKNWPQWPGWVYVDTIKQVVGRDSYDTTMGRDKALQQSVLTFYKEVFWDELKLDQVANQGIANELYDTSVNMGQRIAGRFVQEAINLTTKSQLVTDGIVGASTLSAINSYPRPVLLYRFLNGLQAERYIHILRSDPTQEDFANSWFSRTVTA